MCLASWSNNQEADCTRTRIFKIRARGVWYLAHRNCEIKERSCSMFPSLEYLFHLHCLSLFGAQSPASSIMKLPRSLTAIAALIHPRDEPNPSRPSQRALQSVKVEVSFLRTDLPRIPTPGPFTYEEGSCYNSNFSTVVGLRLPYKDVLNIEWYVLPLPTVSKPPNTDEQFLITVLSEFFEKQWCNQVQPQGQSQHRFGNTVVKDYTSTLKFLGFARSYSVICARYDVERYNNVTVDEQDMIAAGEISAGLSTGPGAGR